MIIHSADKEGAAARLVEAIAAEGYGVTTVEVEEPDRLVDAVEGCAADARILIWSRALVFHSLHSGELPRIRHVPGLIEVSADGIKPPSRGDEARVVLVSGWRGQPFHPGWQRIHLELKRLCGTRKGAAERPSQSPDIRPKPAPTPSASAGGPARGRLVLGGAVGFLLIGTAVGAASWFGGGSPDAQPGRENRQAPKPDPTSGGRPVSALSAKPAIAAAPQAPPAPSPPSAQDSAPAKAERERPQAARTSRPAPPKGSSGSKPRVAPPAQGVKKYSPKYSKVMRQFCERSGRSTPQCQTYLRSVRGR